MMTQKANELPNPRKLIRLDIYLVTTNEDDSDEISGEDFPRWTVLADGEEFHIFEGIDLIEDALARRFKNLESDRPIIVSVAVDLHTVETNSNLA
jgi:hypothetical protein